MTRKRTESLPEKFEDFAKRMEPEMEKLAPKTTNVRVMGGMAEKKWAGIPMWECRCGATTFDAGEAKVHTCKEVRTTDDLEKDGAA